MEEVERLNRMLQTGQIPGGQDEHLRNGTLPRPAGNNALVIVTSPSALVIVTSSRALVLVTSPSALVAPRGAGAPFPLFPALVHSPPHLLLFFKLFSFSFSHSLYLFSSFVYFFPLSYQSSPTPFPGQRS